MTTTSSPSSCSSAMAIDPTYALAYVRSTRC
jgi:hypothetical protein